MSGSLSAVGLLEPLGDGPTLGNEGGRAATLASPAAPFGLGPGEVVPPAVVLGPADLSVDEAVDALMGDDGAAGFQGQASSHLLGRPAPAQAVENLIPQEGIALQTGTLLAAGAGLLLGIGGLIALGLGAIALQFSSHGRWRAIQTFRDLADRVSCGMKTGNFTPIFNGEVPVSCSHGNTLTWCCTSFVNLTHALSGNFLR